METLSDKRVKARKEHTCDFCEKKIVKGEEYRRSIYVYDGEIYTLLLKVLSRLLSTRH